MRAGGSCRGAEIKHAVQRFLPRMEKIEFGLDLGNARLKNMARLSGSAGHLLLQTGKLLLCLLGLLVDSGDKIDQCLIWL